MKISLFKISCIFLSFTSTYSIGSKQEFKTKFRPCVDNSDCANLGYSYACFLYMCYPWEQPDSPDHPTCNSDIDCWNGEGTCKWDESAKLLNRGICFREIIPCETNDDCVNGTLTNCCSNYCCPPEYYHAWREFPCHTHVSCQELNTGSHCCNEIGEVIKNPLNIKNHPSEKTRCCFEDKKREELILKGKDVFRNTNGESITVQKTSIYNGLDKPDIVQINSGILPTTRTSPGKEYRRKTQLEKSTSPETIMPRFSDDVGYTEMSNGQSKLVIPKHDSKSLSSNINTPSEGGKYLVNSENNLNKDRHNERQIKLYTENELQSKERNSPQNQGNQINSWNPNLLCGDVIFHLFIYLATYYKFTFMVVVS